MKFKKEIGHKEKSFKSLLYRHRTRDFNAAWEVLADEMTEYFGENCYWIFYKKEHRKIRNAFKICQEKGISSLKYLLGILKRI
jgi:hypothetical protein